MGEINPMLAFTLMSAIFSVVAGLEIFAVFGKNAPPPSPVWKNLARGIGALGFGVFATGFTRMDLWADSLLSGHASWGVKMFFAGLGMYLIGMTYSYFMTKGRKLSTDSVDYQRSHRRYRFWRRSYRKKSSRRRR